MEHLEQLGLEVSKLIRKQRLDELLDRLDEHWQRNPPQTEEEEVVLTTLLTSNYRIVAIKKMMKKFEEGDLVMQRAIKNYPSLSIFRKLRLDYMIAAVEQGVSIKESVLEEARSSAEIDQQN